VILLVTAPEGFLTRAQTRRAAVQMGYPILIALAGAHFPGRTARQQRAYIVLIRTLQQQLMARLLNNNSQMY
jgi:hypothetical protein